MSSEWLPALEEVAISDARPVSERPRKLRWIVWPGLGFLVLGLFTLNNNDWVAGLGVLLAGILFVGGRIAARWRARVNWVAMPLVAVVFWFSTVDYTVTRARCCQCDLHHVEIQYRFCGLAFIDRKIGEHGDFFANLGEDLGVPCRHRYQRWRAVRLRGLFYCDPCGGGTCCLSGPGDTTQFRKQTRAYAARHPEVGHELQRRWIEGLDSELFLRALVREIREEKVESKE